MSFRHISLSFKVVIQLLLEVWGRKSLGMWCLISPTRKKWLFACRTRDEIWNHLCQQKTGVSVWFCRWVEGERKPWTMDSLPRDLPLYWVWSESTFFSGAPWNFVYSVCALVINCFTFFQGLLCVSNSLPKFARFFFFLTFYFVLEYELTHWKRPWCWEGLGQEEKGTTEDEMAGWHHWLDGRESEWTPGVGDGQGGLACCDSWGHRELDTTERLKWTEQFINNGVLVSGVQQNDSVISHTRISILFQILFPVRLLQNIKQSYWYCLVFLTFSIIVAILGSWQT